MSYKDKKVSYDVTYGARTNLVNPSGGSRRKGAPGVPSGTLPCVWATHKSHTENQNRTMQCDIAYHVHVCAIRLGLRISVRVRVRVRV